jgi:hypothetical protein
MCNPERGWRKHYTKLLRQADDYYQKYGAFLLGGLWKHSMLSGYLCDTILGGCFPFLLFEMRLQNRVPQVLQRIFLRSPRDCEINDDNDIFFHSSV